MFLFIACTSAPPDAPAPVAPPVGPSAETLATAETLRGDAAAADAAFAAAYAGVGALSPTETPCAVSFEAPVLWAGTPGPRAPGVAEAEELLHAVAPERYAAPVVAPPVGVPEPAPAVGTGPEDFARVRKRLDGATLVYVERTAEPPRASTGRAFVWDGRARTVACIADVSVSIAAPAGAESAVNPAVGDPSVKRALDEAILHTAQAGARTVAPAGAAR